MGQGLAGTCLAWRMWDRRMKFRLLERAERREGTAGAGIVTPVYGHGMHLEWKVEKYLDEAVEFYRTIEAVLAGEQYFYPFRALRVFGGEDEREAFDAKRDDLEPWIGEVHDRIGGGVRGAFGGVSWNRGGWLRRQRFLDASKGFFRSQGLYEQRLVTDEELLESGPKLTVLCEGSAGLGSGLFEFLPEQRSKGETLTLRIPGLTEDRILTNDGWMIPRGGALFRAGAGYVRTDLGSDPTPAGRERVEYVVRSLTDLHYEVLEHVAELRPTLATNRPVIGMHPEIPRLAIFNGLGAKGTLYAPGIAGMFVRHLLDGAPLDAEVDVARLGG